MATVNKCGCTFKAIGKAREIKIKIDPITATIFDALINNSGFENDNAIIWQIIETAFCAKGWKERISNALRIANNIIVDDQHG